MKTKKRTKKTETRKIKKQTNNKLNIRIKKKKS